MNRIDTKSASSHQNAQKIEKLSSANKFIAFPN
jgi:hypothetical protein